jgi:MFS family permease
VSAGRSPLALLSRNASYRRLWLAELISFVGDWFTLVALVRIVHDATGGRLAVGVLFAVQIAPSLLLSSIAGSAADRIPRRTVMIASDCLRAAGALGFLALAPTGAVPAILALSAFQHSVTAFFRPAAQASIPHVVAPEDLVSAGTLDGLSWSLGLVLGAALGGLAVDHLGVTGAFVIDAVSFLGSAAVIRTLPLPRVAAAPSDGGRPRASGLGDFGDLLHEMRRSAPLTVALFAKCAWGVGAGLLLLLTEFGDRLLGATAASTGFGLLYAARGIGTAFGPLAARRVLGESDSALRASIAAGFAAAAVFYALFSLKLPLVLALACVGAAHAGGSAIWIGATVLIQRLAPDPVRGRAFAFEMALHTVTACASPILAGWLVDQGLDPSSVVAIFAGLTFAFGLAWTVAAWRTGRAAAPRHR